MSQLKEAKKDSSWGGRVGSTLGIDMEDPEMAEEVAGYEWL